VTLDVKHGESKTRFGPIFLGTAVPPSPDTDGAPAGIDIVGVS
jgi:hypothetical protein